MIQLQYIQFLLWLIIHEKSSTAEPEMLPVNSYIRGLRVKKGRRVFSRFWKSREKRIFNQSCPPSRHDVENVEKSKQFSVSTQNANPANGRLRAELESALSPPSPSNPPHPIITTTTMMTTTIIIAKPWSSPPSWSLGQSWPRPARPSRRLASRLRRSAQANKKWWFFVTDTSS